VISRRCSVGLLVHRGPGCGTSAKENVLLFIIGVQLRVHLLDDGFRHRLALPEEQTVDGRFTQSLTISSVITGSKFVTRTALSMIQ